MSTDLYVFGYRPADETWNKMKAVWESCEAIGIDVPEPVVDFFEGNPPGDRPGAEVSLGEAMNDWRGRYERGYQIDVSKLPTDVKFIRVYMG